MFCRNCGKEISMESNFCNNCGTKIEPVIIENLKSPLKPEEAVKIVVSNKSQNIIQKILTSLLLAAILGLFSYPISNAILEVDKKDLSPDDFSFQMRVGADNASLRRQDLMGQSVNNALIVGVVSFFIIIGIKFITLEKDQENITDRVDPLIPDQTEPKT
jgi:hypothetical protein